MFFDMFFGTFLFFVCVLDNLSSEKGGLVRNRSPLDILNKNKAHELLPSSLSHTTLLPFLLPFFSFVFHSRDGGAEEGMGLVR